MMQKVDISGGLADFWDYIRTDRPHRWPIWGVTIALTGVVFWGFSTHLVRPDKPTRDIVYFESWAADRSRGETEAEWIARAKETTRRNAERRAEYQRLADRLGIAYDSRKADDVTREALGSEASNVLTPATPPRTAPARPSLAERAARRSEAGTTAMAGPTDRP